MRSIAIFLFAAAAFGCANAPQPIQSNTASSNSSSNEKPQTVIAHSSENQPAPAIKNGEKSKWTQGGEAIDTKEYDDSIKAAEKAPAKDRAEAYYKRAVALTEARQYASALGDYRKAAKLDPSNTQAKEWVDKIIMIYDGMNKDYPKEGEEPPALPFNK